MEVNDVCSGLESYVCSNINCDTRLCNRCYRQFNSEESTTIVPSPIADTETPDNPLLYCQEINETPDDIDNIESEDEVS